MNYPPEIVDFNFVEDLSAIKLFFTHNSHKKWVELKDKIIAIKFEQNDIKINRFCGIKNPIFIDNKEIEGFYNSIVTTKNGSYNYIYVMKGNKKIAKISEQYHKNFNDLSSEIEKRYKNLGFINSNFISELKDMF